MKITVSHISTVHKRMKENYHQPTYPPFYSSTTGEEQKLNAFSGSTKSRIPQKSKEDAQT